MKNIELRERQSWLVNEIKKNIEDRTKEESLLSLSDYDLNKATQIKIKLPVGSGHTFLTAYLSMDFDSVIINTDVDHWQEIANYRKELDNGEPCSNSTIVSVFELFYAIHHANLVHQPVKLLSSIETLKKRISAQSLVIVDKASSIPTLVEDFILSVARGPVVFLD